MEMFTWNDTVLDDLIESYFHQLESEYPNPAERTAEINRLMEDWNRTISQMRSEPYPGQDHLSVRYMRVRPYTCGTVLILTTLAGIVCSTLVAVRLLRPPRRHPWALTLLTLSMVTAAMLFLVAGLPLLIVENVFGYGWVLGEAACQAHRYIIFATFYAMGHTAVMLMLYLTLAALKPRMMAQWGDWRVTATGSVILWVLILVCNIPNLLGHGISEEIAGVSFCYHLDIAGDKALVHAWTILQFTFTFAIPLAAMTTLTALLLWQRYISNVGEYTILQDDCYQRRQVATFGIVLAVTFTLCWAPDKILSLVLVLHQSYISTTLLVASDVIMVLAYSYPLVNSVVLLLTFPDLVCVDDRKPNCCANSSPTQILSPRKNGEEQDIITSV